MHKHSINHPHKTIQTLKTFEELGVITEIRKAIDELGFLYPMPIQHEVIPYLLGHGNDVIALAQTGTGKTAAYGIPVIQKIDLQDKHTQALILSPTRELCVQITDDLKDFSKYMPGLHILAVYGGASIENQIKQLRKGAQIIVATPGRLIDLMQRGVADLQNVKNVVLDEADEMLNMGFTDSINAIFEGIRQEKNTLLFSATMSKEIEKIARKYLHNHKEIVVGSRNEGAELVNHVYYMVHAKDKYAALKRIVDYHPKIYAIIFCRTKIETQEIADKLIKGGYNAEALHGDLSQQQRDLSMQKFRNHVTQLLVATDVAARGLDVEDLTHVINYGMPDDIESYTHRSGRTGRAGKTGTSIAIVHLREKSKIREVEKIIGKKFLDGTLPTPMEICTKQLYKNMEQILKTDVDEQEIQPFMDQIRRHFEYIDKDLLIQKIVSMTFGKFLQYYANAPEIEKPSAKAEKQFQTKTTKKRSAKASQGYTKIKFNLGKNDGFYPGEIMQLINRHIHGRQDIGHIDLTDRSAVIEVPTQDVDKVINLLTGQYYRNKKIQCRPFADKSHEQIKTRNSKKQKGIEERKNFFAKDKRQLVGEIPDFTEEGWARRSRRKK